MLLLAGWACSRQLWRGLATVMQLRQRLAAAWQLWRKLAAARRLAVAAAGQCTAADCLATHLAGQLRVLL